MLMKRFKEIHFLNKILVLSLIFSLVLFGAYCLGKKIRNKNSNTMVFTKGSPPVATIPEKAPEKEVPTVEWEDVVPEENFDWDIPDLFDLPSGQSWKIVNPDSSKHSIPTTIYVRGFGEIPLPGTLYWSGTFKYGSLSYNTFERLLESLDKGWEQCLDYKGEEICGAGLGSGGSSIDGIVKMNGPLIRTVILVDKLWDSKRDLYIYISAPINIEDYITFE